MNPLPREIQVEPVGHCARRWTKDPSGLRDDGPPYAGPVLYRYEAFCRLVDQLEPGSELELRGIGEPLLHPRIFDMVAYAAGRGLRVSTESDLPALSQRRADECAASGLRHLRVRAKSPAAASLAHLERLSQAKRRARSPFPLVTVVTPNAAELAQIERKALAAGAEAVELLPAEPRRERCDLPWRKVFISARGDAQPCCMAAPHQARLGNVDREGLQRVWEGEGLRDWRARLASGNPPGLCRGCAAYGSR